MFRLYVCWTNKDYYWDYKINQHIRVWATLLYWSWWKRETCCTYLAKALAAFLAWTSLLMRIVSRLTGLGMKPTTPSSFTGRPIHQSLLNFWQLKRKGICEFKAWFTGLSHIYFYSDDDDDELYSYFIAFHLLCCVSTCTLIRILIPCQALTATSLLCDAVVCVRFKPL